jgi:hypothetical protein
MIFKKITNMAKFSISNLLLFVLLLLLSCNKDSDQALYQTDKRIRSIEIFKNEINILNKHFEYVDNKLIKITSNPPLNNPENIFPFKHEFEYSSENNVKGKYYIKYINEWILERSSIRNYEDERIKEYINYIESNPETKLLDKITFEYNSGLPYNLKYYVNYGNELKLDRKELCQYSEGEIIETQIFYRDYGMDSMCIKNIFIRNEHLLNEILEYDRYYTGEWELNDKLSFTYSNNRIQEVVSYKKNDTLMLPITKYSFDYDSEGLIKKMIINEMYSNITYRFEYSYEKGEGNFNKLRIKYPYARWGYWIPNISLKYSYPPFL